VWWALAFPYYSSGYLGLIFSTERDWHRRAWHLAISFIRAKPLDIFQVCKGCRLRSTTDHHFARTCWVDAKCVHYSSVCNMGGCRHVIKVWTVLEYMYGICRSTCSSLCKLFSVSHKNLIIQRLKIRLVFFLVLFSSWARFDLFLILDSYVYSLWV